MLHCFHFPRVGKEFPIANDMAEVVDFVQSKLAFGQLERQTCLLQTAEYFVQVLQVLFPAVAIDYHVIDVGLSKSSTFLEHPVHQPVKVAGAVWSSKGITLNSYRPKRVEEGCEGRFLLRLLCHGHLPVPSCQVRVGVKLCHLVDFAVIHAETDIAIFLLNQDYRGWTKVELLPAPTSCLISFLTVSLIVVDWGYFPSDLVWA